jgi:hypothetical protein
MTSAPGLDGAAGAQEKPWEVMEHLTLPTLIASSWRWMGNNIGYSAGGFTALYGLTALDG